MLRAAVKRHLRPTACASTFTLFGRAASAAHRPALNHLDGDLHSRLIETEPWPCAGASRFSSAGFAWQTSSMNRWEYSVETLNHLSVAWLNERGADGWELVAAVPDDKENRVPRRQYEVVFKRLVES